MRMSLFQSPLSHLSDLPPAIARQIRVKGIVQGVGFRPTVYRTAQACKLRGWVRNDAEGVLIGVAGTPAAIALFIDTLQRDVPPLARIDQIVQTEMDVGAIAQTNFVIAQSQTGRVQTKIAPDAATCSTCHAEIFDPNSRHYRYPFTNCTHCGPRFSIIRRIPYDRPNTSMAAFPMCPDCQQEYGDVLNRRFHAQPVACAVCGPQVWLEDSDGLLAGQDQEQHDAIAMAARLLKDGNIVAVKGLGGIHLACSATDEAAVQQLRQRKRRYDKPFALMARDVDMVQRYCAVDDSERSLLTSPAAPIVLLHQRADAMVTAIAPSVSPELSTLGFMLPYTPLHHWLMAELDIPIVLTSGNLSDEPQCIDNETARDKLGAIASYFLLHNRDIVNRVDDSVVRVVQGRTPHHLQTLRRARGYAPAPIALPVGFENAPPMLAMGSELKNTVALLRDGEAIVSQHLGDLENMAALNAYQDTLDLYRRLFEHEPAAIAIDLHPEYLSSKLGQQLAESQAVPLYAIQHHHAHIAACMVEHGLPLDEPPVLGIALDGLGYGSDGTLWGGEFLRADYRSAERLAHFPAIAMLGGEQAIRQPWRNTYAHLMAVFSWEELRQDFGGLELMQYLDQKPRSLLDQMLATQLRSPLASSAGRLFDAVAAAVGCCRDSTRYEGQGAIALEALIQPNDWQAAQDAAYTIGITSGDRPSFDLKPLWLALLGDLRDGTPPAQISARFHLGLANAIATLAHLLTRAYRLTHVILSGGVFQNQVLLVTVQEQLTKAGLTVWTPHNFPPNDGGLSLGQGAIAAAQWLQFQHQSNQPM
jgi:hydrogenase maturation protein HypF